MDWAEEKYDVSFYFWGVITSCLFSGPALVHFLSLFAAETPHCSDKNGAEGPFLIHPPANVLDLV